MKTGNSLFARITANNVLNEQGLGGACELAAAKASVSLAPTVYPCATIYFI